MDAEEIAKKARKSISAFCIDECKAFCCRKGYLVMTDKETDLVTQGLKTQLQDKKILNVCTVGGYSMNMGAIDTGCPSLKDCICTIHKSRKRPDTCRQYPLFIEGKTIKLSSRCLAVKTGILYPYIVRLRSLGYRIINGDLSADSELYRMLPDQKEPVLNPKEPEKDNEAEIMT